MVQFRAGQAFAEDLLGFSRAEVNKTLNIMNTNINRSGGQVLRTVVQEGLTAFPEDAHVRLFQFLKQGGASDQEQKDLQQAWTRVVMASEAFGRKKGGPVDPARFSEDLVKELCSENKEVGKLEDMLATFRAILASQENRDQEMIENIHDLKKSTGVLSNLQSMTKVGADLKKAQSSIYPERGVVGQAKEGSTQAEGAILLHRRASRGIRFSWHQRKPAAASPLYSPLCLRDLGGAEVLYGDGVYRGTAESGGRPSSSPVIGIRVSSSQVCFKARGWTSFQCLHEILPMGPERLRLFPPPLGTVESEAHPGTTFIFNLPNCKPLKPLLGAGLSTFLRKYPSVILTWCAQIGAASRSFENMVSGRMLRLPTLSDVFVSDNGQLLVGNTVYDEAEDSDGSGEQPPDLDVSDFFQSLLTSVLSLSRTVQLPLSASIGDPTVTEEQGDAPTPADEGEGEGVGEGETLSMKQHSHDAKEEVVSVVEGCSLELLFTSHISKGVHVINTIGGRSEASLNQSNLQVHVHGDDTVAGVQGGAWNASVTGVTVTANSPGSILLRVVSQAALPQGSLSARRSYKALDVRVVVVPAYPVMSVELAELLAHLEGSYTSKNNDMFLSAECVRVRDFEATMRRYDEVTVSDDWASIVSSLNQTRTVSSSARRASPSLR